MGFFINTFFISFEKSAKGVRAAAAQEAFSLLFEFDLKRFRDYCVYNASVLCALKYIALQYI